MSSIFFDLPGFFYGVLGAGGDKPRPYLAKRDVVVGAGFIPARLSIDKFLPNLDQIIDYSADFFKIVGPGGEG